MKQKTKLLGLSVLFLTAGLALTACKNKNQNASETAVGANQTEAKQDEHIQVQHILVGFKGTLPGKDLKRSQAEAEKLANEIYDKAKKGGDFDALVKQYTDDRAPGIYGMSNRGVAPVSEEFPREQMVPAFGDIGFNLKVGDVGIAAFDKGTSPFGYHIIKRLK